MCDHEDLLELGLDGLDRLDNALAAFLVLRAEALINDQRLQPRTGAVSEEARQSDANGEVHAEALATAEQLVAAGAQLVAYLDVQRLDCAQAGTHVALRFEAHVHAARSHPPQDAISLFLDLGNSRLDDHRLHPAPTKGMRQVAVDGLLAPQRILPRQAVLVLALQERAVVESNLSVLALIATRVAPQFQLAHATVQLQELSAIQGQRLHVGMQLVAAGALGSAFFVEALHGALQLSDLLLDVPR